MQHRGALATILGGRKTYPRLGAVTTVPNQTVTIQEWNATALTVIDWGDGQTTNHPALTGTAVSHIYAVAGTYTIQLQVNPLAVTRMDFRGVGLRVYSAYLRRCVNTVYFRCDTGPLGILNSVDMVDWRPAYWLCFNLPAGFTGVLNSADMVDWRPTTWYCYDLPTGFTGVFNSADIVNWRLTNWQCYGLPTGFTGVFNSADIVNWRPTTWICYGLPAGFTGVLNSADMVNWRPTYWYCYGLPAGFTGVLNSADMVNWRPTTWICFNLPAGFTGVFNFADMIDWRPVTWYCYDLPAGLLPLTVAAANFAGWVGCSSFNISGDTLTQVQVDAVLTGLYSAFATRTATGGTINVGGNNAAPSGILQAKCPPATGKEFAYELINDSCGVNPTKKWATVTITA